MFLIKLSLLALIGSLIGWITNRLAVKFLFKPVSPIKLPFGIEIQGVMPRRKNEIAHVIGEVVEKELVSVKELMDKLLADDELDDIKAKLTEKLVQIAHDKIPPMVLVLAGDSITSLITNYMDKEGTAILREFIDSSARNATNKIKVAQIVEDKINALDFEQFEEMVIHMIKKELNHIEVMGAILGFIIGALQGLILLWIK